MDAGLHHADTLTVRTNPGWTVTYTPFVFLKTFLAYLKAAGATPAEIFLFTAAMATVLAELSPAVPFLLWRGITHEASSSFIQARYS